MTIFQRETFHYSKVALLMKQSLYVTYTIKKKNFFCFQTSFDLQIH